MPPALTEEDIFRANKEFIKLCAKRYGSGLEPDERESIADEGFLYAIRSYRKSFSSFQPYAEKVIQLFIKQVKRKNNYVKRSESRLSFDRPVNAESSHETVGNVLFYYKEDYASSIMLKDFIGTLSNNMQFIAQMYINGYTKNNIINIIKISEQELEAYTRRILYCWEQYYGVPEAYR